MTFKEKKILQIIGYILSLTESKKIDISFLHYLLYFIERNNIEKNNFPLFNDAYIIDSNKFILTKISKLLKNIEIKEKYMNFTIKENYLFFNGPLYIGNLSEYDIWLIEKNYDIYRDKSINELYNIIYNLPEFKNKLNIEFRDILIGLDKQNIDGIINEFKNLECVGNILLNDVE